MNQESDESQEIKMVTEDSEVKVDEDSESSEEVNEEHKLEDYNSLSRLNKMLTYATVWLGKAIAIINWVKEMYVGKSTSEQQDTS